MGSSKQIVEKAGSYLQRLCIEIDNRSTGSTGNRAATDFFARTVSGFGFETESPQFGCIDWSQNSAHLSVNGVPFEIFVSPYSLGCQVKAPMVVVSTVEELVAAEISQKVVLMRGEIAREQLMPKNFPFYNPDHHRLIIQLLEAKEPTAIVAATSRDVVMVGSQYPFPLFEDGDFDIPSVYMTEEEGSLLAAYAGEHVQLEIQAERIPAVGCNVIARKGARRDRRVVFFAHIDARMGTPGANDNASGVTSLLLLAELLADYSGSLGVELVAMNGEDYFSNPGEQRYLAENAGRFDEIILGVNLDDVAFCKGKIAYSLYGCPDDLAGLVRDVFSEYPDFIEGEAWYQGDHGLFLMNQTPALAITSELLDELMAEFIHTPRDTAEIVDTNKLVTVALSLRDLVLRLDQQLD